jgi:hypothetical protein
MDDDDRLPSVIICQGPPRCMLEGDEAVAAAKAGCPWCRRIELLPDGTERRSGPPLADEGMVA